MNDMLGSVDNIYLPTSFFDYSKNAMNYTTSVTAFSPYFVPKMEEKPTDELQINIKKSPIKFNFNL